jgi:alkane 1-monooxygenase
MRAFKYAFVYIIPAAAWVGLSLGGGWLALTPLLVFGLIPLAELIIGGETSNPTADEADQRLGDWRYKAVIYAALPVMLGVLALFLTQVAAGAFVGIELLGAIVTAGLCCGGLGINIGHELGHRPNRREQHIAKLLLGTSLYAHFFIEHNRGHHARVATPDDPASSRKGEWVYTFWFRSVLGGCRSAWNLEAARLRRRGVPVWSRQNEMLRLQAWQAAALLAVGLALGPVAVLAWAAAGLVGALLLETVNYLEHYGLSRELNARGRWERVLPAHSWNSDHTLGRLLLFELTRHSDHHAHPKRPYPVLRHFDEAPQLPTGYPGMILLALVPPLFFAVMHPRLTQAVSAA